MTCHFASPHRHHTTGRTKTESRSKSDKKSSAIDRITLQKTKGALDAFLPSRRSRRVTSGTGRVVVHAIYITTKVCLLPAPAVVDRHSPSQQSWSQMARNNSTYHLVSLYQTSWVIHRSQSTSISHFFYPGIRTVWVTQSSKPMVILWCI